MNLRRLRCLAGLAAVTVAVGCAAAPRQRAREMGPVDTGAGSLDRGAQGTWRDAGRWCPSRSIRRESAPVRLTGQGTLVYDNFGNLQMDLRPDEQAAAQLERAGVTTKQGVISTSGRVVVDVPGRKLTYVLEGQPAGNGGPLSMERPRYWQVEAMS